ncbi:hypothetical protein JOB18_040212 [Solea senegalensis]|uniref:Secreted protein n=1 Tax=Solea senegalensis TaxID=28829 RepID=A0AAV6T147_SOLSE|nr:hypothetical protein JOB18_040212 [Solea senegalensis]
MPPAALLFFGVPVAGSGAASSASPSLSAAVRCYSFAGRAPSLPPQYASLVFVSGQRSCLSSGKSPDTTGSKLSVEPLLVLSVQSCGYVSELRAAGTRVGSSSVSSLSVVTDALAL